MIERTLSIIKPDATRGRKIGEIMARIEKSGLRIVAAKMLSLSKRDAGRFYAVHKDKAFYASLTDFMSSGPVLVSVLEGQGAIVKWRTIMGATDPARAEEGTVRRDFGTNVEQNATHGSDGPDTARWEIGFFFAELDICDS